MGWLGLRGWPYVLGKDHSYTFLSPYVEKSSLHRPDMLQAKKHENRFREMTKNLTCSITSTRRIYYG